MMNAQSERFRYLFVVMESETNISQKCRVDVFEVTMLLLHSLSELKGVMLLVMQ